MEDFILEEMEKYGADGVDFVSISLEPNGFPTTIFGSYTKAQWIASDRSYPRSGRRYWKLEDGRKKYL